MNAFEEQLSNTAFGRKSRLYALTQGILEKFGRNPLRAQYEIFAAADRAHLVPELCGDALKDLDADYQSKQAALDRRRFLLEAQLAEIEDERKVLKKWYAEERKTRGVLKAHEFGRVVADDISGKAVNGKGGASNPVPNEAMNAVPRSSQTIPAGAVQGEAVRDREGVGPRTDADGHRSAAHPPRDTNDDAAGLNSDAQQANDCLPAASSPELNGGGQFSGASDGLLSGAPSREAGTVRPKTDSKPPVKIHQPAVDRVKDLEVERALKNHMAESILSSWRLSDGNLVCSMPLHELKRRDEDGDACRFIREAVLVKYAPSTVDERRPAKEFLTVAELEFCRELALEAKRLKREAA